MSLLEFDAVTKTYERRGTATRALDGLTLRIEPGEFVAVVGPSGSGKSTLLHLAAALDLPTSGRVRIDGRDVAAMTEAQRTDLRRYRIGLVFQFFNLLPTLTIDRNIALPLLLDGRPLGDALPAAEALLDRIGLRHRAAAFPDELSGGEMQRVAIARALVTNPVLLLADEPTGNLDSVTSGEIMALIRASAQENRRTTLLVTHDAEIARQADRVIRIRDGRAAADEPSAPDAPAADHRNAPKTRTEVSPA